MKSTENKDLVHQSLWRLAEQQTLLLMRSQKLTPEGVIRQYTGKDSRQAELEDAVGAIYSFNLNEAYKNGFVAY